VGKNVMATDDPLNNKSGLDERANSLPAIDDPAGDCSCRDGYPANFGRSIRRNGNAMCLPVGKNGPDRLLHVR
jgi:hypothetical protein